MKQLTINKIQEKQDTRSTQIFAVRKSAVTCQMSVVSCSSKGFTLVETIVSIGLFTIVMFIATSAFLSIVSADRKARTVRIASDNLNIALEDMSRRIKTGTSYYCGDGTEPPTTTNDCASGGVAIFFKDKDDNLISYKKDGPVIKRRVGLFEHYLDVTSPEVQIDTLKFFVAGSTLADAIQPSVTILISGSLGVGAAKSSFTMQTTVAQRSYDK